MPSPIATAGVAPRPRVDIRRLLRDRRILSLADQALMSAVNMCSAIIIARTCTKQQLGLYASGLSLVLFMTAVQSALISLPYTIFSPHIKGEEHRTFKGSAFLQQSTLAAVGMLTFLFLG